MEEGEADFVLQSATNYAALASVHAAENSKTTEEILVRWCQLCLCALALVGMRLTLWRAAGQRAERG